MSVTVNADVLALLFSRIEPKDRRIKEIEIMYKEKLLNDAFGLMNQGIQENNMELFNNGKRLVAILHARMVRDNE